MKIRSGVSSSQWAGECGEYATETTQAEFWAFATECERKAKTSPKLQTWTKGTIVSADWQGTDPDAFEVTEVICELRGADKDDWTCGACDGEGCAACNDGYSHGEDRFVVVHNDIPYLCLTRYYQILTNESED